MDTVSLDAIRNVAAQSTAVDTEAGAVIMAEVAGRLVEFYEARGGYALMRWVQRAGAIALQSPDALVLYLHAQAGDTAWFATPYSELAAKNMRTKQAEQQWFDDALKSLRVVAPDVADQVDAMRKTFRR